MADSKYGKYIVTELKKDIVEAPWNPPPSEVGRNRGGRVLFLDNEVVEGAHYLECVWMMPRPAGSAPVKATVEPHTHDYDEVICFFGTDPEDFHELHAEIELWLGDEKHIITKTAIVFIPAGLQHCPLIIHRVDKPVFTFTSFPGKMYV
jgi:hypothetical protein